MKWRDYVLLLFLLSLPLSIKVLAQEEKFFMVMQIEQDPNAILAVDAIPYKVTNITTNMKNYQGNKIHYDLEKSNFWISNDTMHLNQPFQRLYTDTPNVVKTRNSEMGIDLVQIKENYERELNTLTNVTTYTSSSPLYIDGQTFIDDLNVTAVVYPNSTGILELRQP